MHADVHSFVVRVRAELPQHFRGCRVLEIGSYNVNGSVRQWFEGCDYLGVDWRPGPGVDRVCLAHELDEPPESRDTVISTETLEHDKFWPQTLAKAWELLKPGGLLVVTTAGFDRPPHELEAGVDRHYAPQQPDELRPHLRGFLAFYEEQRTGTQGIRFACRKENAPLRTRLDPPHAPAGPHFPGPAIGNSPSTDS